MSESSIVANQGFNDQILKSWKRKTLRKRFFRTFVYSSLIIIALGLFSLYLSRLPRERIHRKASFAEKVKLGAQKLYTTSVLNIQAEHETPHTKLPIAEIFIKGKRLDNLNENLPESGRDEQKAKFKIHGKEYDVDARYRGDSLNHWVFPNKSWRVVLKKDKRHNGMKAINLTVPRVDTQISNYLGYKMAERIGGILTPQADLVHFRLNRKYDGVRLLLEQPDLEFMESRDLPPGKIFTGDISSEHIYGGLPRKNIYIDSSAWSVLSSSPDESKRELAALLRLIGNEGNPYLFYKKIQKILDVDATLRYMALLELVSSIHVDATHNGKLYFNSYNGKLQPVVWDTVAYFWKNSQNLDLGTNLLFKKLLDIPEFREAKDRHLWQYIHNDLSEREIISLIETITYNMRDDIYAFPLKLHANDKGLKHISNNDWEKAIKELKETIIQRHSRIRNHIKKAEAKYNYQISGKRLILNILISGNSGVTFDKLAIKGADLNLKSFKRVGIEDLMLKKPKQDVQQLKSGSGLEILPKDMLFSKRRKEHKKPFVVVPAKYKYILTFNEVLPKNLNVSLALTNSITNSQVKSQKSGFKIDSQQKKNMVWWSPEQFEQTIEKELSGNIVLKEKLVVAEQEKLIIRAGSKIKLAPGVSIIADGGEIIFDGEEDRPIELSRLNPNRPWGAVVGLNQANLILNNVKFSGGSSAHHNLVRFNAPLSIHYAKAQVDQCSFDNLVSFYQSEIEISNSKFETIYQDPIWMVNTIFSEKDNEYIEKTPEHSPMFVNKKAFGTPGRWEREYKYTFTNLDPTTRDPLEIADEIRDALAERANDRSFWSVYKYIDTSYYADERAKDFFFTDIYFDNEERLNHKYGVSYRFRNRYSSYKAYQYHNKRFYLSRFWPYRLEFQAKTKREELGGGFSETLESRFEFRKESAPFSETKTPPAPPWDRDFFIPAFESGYFDGMLTAPAQEIMKFYKNKIGNEKNLIFKPSSVVLTNRYRQHLNIQTPWGSGPNPEQSYIISLDHSLIYRAEDYMRFLTARRLGNKKYPEPAADAQIVEIEVEFERNVSDQLDRAIKEAVAANDTEKAKKLKETRAAFLEDQKNIMNLITDYFAQQNIEVKPIGKSKYVQSMDLLEGEL